MQQNEMDLTFIFIVLGVEVVFWNFRFNTIASTTLEVALSKVA